MVSSSHNLNLSRRYLDLFHKKELLLALDRVTTIVKQQNREKDMLNQSDMTQEASVVFACLSRLSWWSAAYLGGLLTISEARCQFILTQLAMAGLVEEDKTQNKFKRC